MATKTKRASGQTQKNTKQSASHNRWKRSPFLFYSVLGAAALVAISLGLMTYEQRTNSTIPVETVSSSGILFLQSLDTAETYRAGDELDVTIYENSGNQGVNALQAAIKYPAEQLQVTSVSNTNSFTQEAATDTSTPGLVRVARSIKPGDASLRGAKPVAVVKFKVVAEKTDAIELIVDNTASLLVRSSDNQNILDPKATTTLEL